VVFQILRDAACSECGAEIERDGLLLGALAGALAAVSFVHFRETPPEVHPAQFTVEPPGDTQFTNAYAATAISPDGRYLIFGAGQVGTGTSSLWLRPLDSLSARPLIGTDNGSFPFWSPDGRSIAFFSGGKLKRSAVAGGAPQVICDAPANTFAGAGGTWSRDGILLFGSPTGLFSAPASGGVPRQITQADTARKESGHGVPQFLPDGKRFLYFIASEDPNIQGIYAGSLENPKPGMQKEHVRILATDRKAYYAPSPSGQTGYLLWMQEKTLLAQRFDDRKLRLEGDPAPVADGLNLAGNVRAPFWISDAGLLAFRTGNRFERTKLVWMGRDGKILMEAGKADASKEYLSGRLSPDGKRYAVDRRDDNDNDNEDIWVLEFGRDIMSRLTFDPKWDQFPVWSPDGRQIAWASERSGVRQIYRKDASGEGQEEQLTNGPTGAVATDWSRDGRYLLYTGSGPKTGWDIGALPLEGDRKPFEVLQTPFNEGFAQFSPDGKWIAYASDESGRSEIYVRAFPASPGGRWQVSNQGGSMPKWRADGKELYYLGPTRSNIMAAGIRISLAGVQTDTPRQLFAISVPPSDVTVPYDVSGDGQSFLVTQPANAQLGPAPLTVVLNWQDGLKK
jgi:Tol biopolymer transport system component